MVKKYDLAHYTNIQNTDPEDNFNVLPRIGRDSNLTQFTVYGTANGAQTVLYTVPTDYTLYITYYSLSVNNAAAGVAGAYLQALTGSLGNWFNIYFGVLPSLGYCNLAAFLNPPLEVPTGYKICLYSSVANCDARTSLHGYTKAN